MNRRQGNLPARLEKIEQVVPSKGAQFFMIWGRTETGLADALAAAKADGSLQVGDRFDAKLWTHATEPPPARWISLAELSDEELKIIADHKDRAIDDNKPTPAQHAELCRISDAELSTVYARDLPVLGYSEVVKASGKE
jgi:hypothetical protein